MLLFLLRRIGTMLVTALCLTFVVFYLTNLPAKLETLAKTQAGARISDAEVRAGSSATAMPADAGALRRMAGRGARLGARGTRRHPARSLHRARRRPAARARAAGSCRATGAGPPASARRWAR
jgi:hypothetical protein